MLLLNDFQVKIDHKIRLNIHKAQLSNTGVIGVIGPNGSGKSTLLKSLAGFLNHSGKKLLDNQWPSSNQISYMPQAYLVKSKLKVEDCVLLGQREQLSWRVTEDQRSKVMEILDELQLAHLAKRSMDSLSGGQQQMVLLAQRLSRNPTLLLLDEPTSALDMYHQLEVLSILQSFIQTHNTTVIIALHELTLASRFTNQLIILKEGKLVSHGDTHELITEELINQVYQIDCQILTTHEHKAIVVPIRAQRSV
ncbi:ABC transporter ATP-binding protein [Nitrincola tibetensis]|uniref:ABC transporter ATP-binding protein n=1 Tax=Nitrincola tibetensis TaxID=2219697 RepID=A0A364NRB7_9GAMM|nr:ABC transporter ATP-binding protein [Nitrincola tibetensis]RAU19417.1 ABC transporter ATP-binding protein [Nitrincola tibetensis]